MVNPLLADVALRFLELTFALDRVVMAVDDDDASLLPSLLSSLDDNPETLALRAIFCKRDDLRVPPSLLLRMSLPLLASPGPASNVSFG